MPKQSSSHTFGRRLAMLRKATGYTQQQLAEEIGTTRRVIAYYEAESDQPPAAILVDLARALNTTTDALLGLSEPEHRRTPSGRMERRMQQIEALNPKAKRQIVQLIDTFIEAEQIRQQMNEGG